MASTTQRARGATTHAVRTASAALLVATLAACSSRPQCSSGTQVDCVDPSTGEIRNACASVAAGLRCYDPTTQMYRTAGGTDAATGTDASDDAPTLDDAARSDGVATDVSAPHDAAAHDAAHTDAGAHG